MILLCGLLLSFLSLSYHGNTINIVYFDKLLGGGEAADTERQQDPSTGVAALRWILGQLFANLTVNFIPDQENKQNQIFVLLLVTIQIHFKELF